MPGANLPASDYFVQQLQDMQNQIRALATQGAGLPGAESYVNGTLTTSSPTPVTIAGSPVVECVIGISGDCHIDVGAFVGIGAGNEALVYVVIDSHPPATIIGLSGPAVGATLYARRRLSSSWGPGLLSQGSHEFQLMYAMVNGSGSVSFSSNWLAVTPV
jgi:hypothetical protein